MRRFLKWSGLGLLALLVAGGLLLHAGNAVHWNRESPYVLAGSWGGEGTGLGQFRDPTGIAVTADEVFVADARNGRVQVFDKDGGFKRAFGNERLGRPMNLAIADGRLYVPDYFEDVIHVFSLQGDYQRAVAADDGLDSPGGLAVYPDGSMLVADTYGQRIVHLAPDGAVLQVWAGAGSGYGEFSYPTDVALAPDGGFYVADGYNDRIQHFGPDREFLGKWGGPFAMNVFGPFKGWFTTVTSVDVGPDGRVFAADFYNDRVQKFSAGGKFLTAFGSPGKGPGQSEIAVSVDADGTVWTANFAGNRIEKWEQPR